MRLIPLTRGQFAKVDNGDYAALAAYSWTAKLTRRKGRNVWHAVTQVKRRPIYMHREIMGARKGREVDHRSGDGLDNRRGNLRLCSHRQNMINRHTTQARSGVRGVVFHARLKSRPWSAVIGVNYRAKHLGYFATKEEATMARMVAAKTIYGEFAPATYAPDQKKAT